MLLICAAETNSGLTDNPTEIAGRNALIEQICLEINLTVGDRNATFR